MPATKLTTESVMKLFTNTQQNYITSSLLMDEFNVTRSTAVKKLNRLIDKGVLRRGDVQHKYYRAHADYMTAEEIKKRLIQYWSDTDHPAIRAVPERHGGKMTAHGSGITTAMNYIINSLIEMDLINQQHR